MIVNSKIILQISKKVNIDFFFYDRKIWLDKFIYNLLKKIECVYIYM